MDVTKTSTSPPKYEILRQHLARELGAERYGNGQKLPSERELMRRHNVSHATVTRALRELENSGLIQRVWGKGTFAGGQPRTATKNLAVTFSSFYDAAHPHLVQILRGIEQAAQAEKWRINLFPLAEGRIYDEGLLPGLLRQRQIDGVVAASPLEIDDLRKLLGHGIATVSIDQDYPALGVMAVMEDAAGAAAQIADHLARCGCRTAGLIMGPDEGGQREMVRASGLFRTSLLHHLPASGVACPKHFILPTNYQWDPIRGTIKHWLSRPDRPDVLVFRDDMLAQHALQLAREQGIDVPGDLSIVSFGDLIPNSVLTSVRVPFQVIGKQAVEMLEAATGAADDHARIRQVSTQLVVRETSQGSPETHKKGGDDRHS